MSKLIVYTDGASLGNPGHAGIGVVITAADGIVLKEISRYIGQCTNNFAEYSALIAGLRAARELGASDIEVRTDSELMARQIDGVYKVKSRNLEPLFAEAMSLLRGFNRFSVVHVRREGNDRADRLAAEAAKTNQDNAHPSVTSDSQSEAHRPPEYEI